MESILSNYLIDRYNLAILVSVKDDGPPLRILIDDRRIAIPPAVLLSRLAPGEGFCGPVTRAETTALVA